MADDVSVYAARVNLTSEVSTSRLSPATGITISRFSCENATVAVPWLVTGPPTKYRPPSDCKDEGGEGGTCTFSLSWHGSVKFKRTH